VQKERTIKKSKRKARRESKRIKEKIAAAFISRKLKNVL